MKAGNGILYIVDENGNIVPVNDMPVLLSCHPGYSPKGPWVTFSDNRTLHEAQSSYNKIKAMVERRSGKPWLEIEEFKTKLAFNPDWIDVKATIAANINIRGVLRKLIVRAPGNPKQTINSNVSGLLEDSSYRQLMQQLGVPEPWTSPASKRTIWPYSEVYQKDIMITENGTQACLVAAGYRRRIRSVIDGERFRYISEYSDKLNINIYQTNMDINEALEAERRLGRNWKMEHVQIKGKYYAAYMRDGITFKEACKRAADAEKKKTIEEQEVLG